MVLSLTFQSTLFVFSVSIQQSLWCVIVENVKDKGRNVYPKRREGKKEKGGRKERIQRVQLLFPCSSVLEREKMLVNKLFV